MKKRSRNIIIFFLYLAIIASIIACGRQLDSQLTEGTQAVGADNVEKRMAYEDEELGIAFSADETLYNLLICEIIPQQTDPDIPMEKITASFYANWKENRVPLFYVGIYAGTFDSAYLKEKKPGEFYLGSADGYTYTIQYEKAVAWPDDQYNIEKEILKTGKTITVTGVMEGIFDTENGNGTKIDFSQETVSTEGVEEEIAIAEVKSDLGYSIQYEPDSFRYEKREETEILTGQSSEGDLYPNIYFSVAKIENGSKEEVLENLRKDKTNTSLKTVKVGQENYRASLLSWKEGKEPGSLVQKNYIIEQDTFLFVIKTGYFNEVESTSGNKLDQMLKSFQIIPNESN